MTHTPRSGGQQRRHDDAQSDLPTTTTTHVADRVRRAFLATKRDELLTPVRVISDVSGHILTVARDMDQPGFSGDILKIQSAGESLTALVHQILAPAAPGEPTVDDESVRSRLRHDMLNELNPVINYSEMWLEDAEEQFLSGFIPELRLIHNAGLRSAELVDKILAAWDIDASDVASDLGDLDHLHAIFDYKKDSAIATEQGHVLVVDDNDINRDILSRHLEIQGHTVVTARDGKEALELLNNGDFDLMLLDIVMPGINGFEVLARTKSDPRLRETPIIMISALEEMEIVARCIELGAEDYLPKPFNPVVLKARVGACLEKRRFRQREISYLNRIEQEKQRADELLHVILPADIVSELKTTNEVAPRRYDNVAVLFADIVDFTSFCEQHSPEEVVSNLQKLVVTWEEIALRHGVQKVKTIGDAFMAACGLFGDSDEPVLNCVRCGLEMIQATLDLPIGWNVRIGIHTGSVVGGVLGRRQYLFDLWGDTVNTAARMESHGIKGSIVLSREAWNRVEKDSQGTPLGAITVKGKGDMEMFRFDGFNETPPSQT
ncbi:Adenylate cyclase [Symmachiella macrocystis]|uniref:histidine kinase n=1 Tax=Symmachiella macrocystis TaxID=2527985 RepID=A0A5C6BRD0_9PLAN|nr:adenylate/guanylate cyclase domain-containing protein [Symmachiella macrocystis]TWU13776.1 Adenylate cyclase [Symmachiella macrocystis]